VHPEWASQVRDGKWLGLIHVLAAEWTGFKNKKPVAGSRLGNHTTGFRYQNSSADLTADLFVFCHRSKNGYHKFTSTDTV